VVAFPRGRVEEPYSLVVQRGAGIARASAAPCTVKPHAFCTGLTDGPGCNSAYFPKRTWRLVMTAGKAVHHDDNRRLT
jgi:hypothetical protein